MQQRMVRRAKRVLAMAMAVCVWAAASACAGPKLTADSFDAYCTRVLKQMIGEDYLTLHFFFDDPEAAGLEALPPTFGHYTAQTEEQAEKEAKENAEIIQTLMQYDRETLSESQQKTYDLLLWTLQSTVPAAPAYYDNPNAPNFGWQAQIQISLAELALDTEEDVENYLALLSDMPRYAEELMQYQQEKKQAGLGISAEQAELAIEECEAFLRSGEENVLLRSFDERIEGIESLSTAQKESYKQRNRDAVQAYCLPAYQTMAEGLENAKDESRDGSLASLPQGRMVYKTLVRQYTMSQASPEEIQEELEEDEEAMLTEMRSLIWQDPAGYQAWERMDLGTEDPEQSVAWFREKMQADFPALWGEVPYTVSQVSPALEDTIQNPAFYMIPYVDKEGVENHIYINEKHLGDSVLPTLAHEGFPGHLYQTNYSRQAGDSVLYQLLTPTGYSEGWANYVENYSYKYLTDSEGAASLCRLNSQLSLNLYCQMDIGVNYLGWDTEELTAFAEMYFDVDEQAMEEMYQIFLASPGEYLQYYYTARQIEKAYDRASEALGSAFDDKAFHRAILEALPTKEGIEKATDAYIEEAGGGKQTGCVPVYRAAA